MSGVFNLAIQGSASLSVKRLRSVSIQIWQVSEKLGSMSYKTIIRDRNGFRAARVNRRRAVRNFCTECCGWSIVEVEKCDGKHLDGSMCAFHSLRSGQGKQDAKKRDAAIKKQCRYCMQGNRFSIGSCTSRYCPIFPYRNYKTDRSFFYPASCSDDEILKSGLPN